nr:cinnamoyl-CoA reductase-like SNL6 [Ipomoea batatas]
MGGKYEEEEAVFAGEFTEENNQIVCVLDASTFVGYWILKKLLVNGYKVHAAVQKNGEKEIMKKIKDLERTEKERVVVYSVDVLNYRSIVDALKGCCGLFCCLDSPDGYDDVVVDLEVRGIINVMEACAQSDSIHKIVFSSSLTAAIWRENISTLKDVDETSWSSTDFCRKTKLWYALAKTLSEQAAWALAMDRMLDMVSINAGLVIGHGVSQLSPVPTLSYLQGAAEMFENGLLAVVDVEFLADVHVRAFADHSTCGRYFCFSRSVTTEEEAVKLAQSLSPLIPLPAKRYKWEANEVYGERLRTKKLSKLVEGTAATAC